MLAIFKNAGGFQECQHPCQQTRISQLDSSHSQHLHMAPALHLATGEHPSRRPLVELQGCWPGGAGKRCGVRRWRPRARAGGGFRSWSEAGHTEIAFLSPVWRAWLLWRTKKQGEQGDKVCHRAVRWSRSGDEGLLAPEPCTAFLWPPPTGGRDKPRQPSNGRGGGDLHPAMTPGRAPWWGFRAPGVSEVGMA